MGEARERKVRKDRRMKIEPGFACCKKCDGWGYEYIKDTEGYYETYFGKKLATKCFRCNGSGQITWVQNVFSNG